MRCLRCLRLCLAAWVFCAFSVSGPVSAQLRSTGANIPTVEISPRFNTEAVYTDNVFLTPRNADQQSDVVLTLSPGVNVAIDGRRIKTSVDLSYDYLIFLRENTTETRERATALIDAEIVDNQVFAEIRASVQPTFLDRAQSLSGSNANISENRRLVQNYSGAVRYDSRFRDVLTWSARYSYGLQLSPADDTDDTTINTPFSDSENEAMSLTISTGERFGRYRFTARGRRSVVSRSLVDTRFVENTATGEIGYRFSRQLEVFGEAGVSSNSLVSEAAGGDGFTWSAGLNWNPSRRSRFSGRYGQAGARTTASASGTFELGRRTSVTLDYVDEVTANSFLQNAGLTNLLFDDRLGITDQSGIPIDQSNPNFTLSDIDFRRRSVSGSVRWRNLRTTLFVNGSYEERIFDNESGVSQNWGVTGGIDRRLTERSDFRATVSYRQNIFEGDLRTDDVVIATAEYFYSFSRYFVASFGYDFSLRSSNDANGDLLENAVRLEIRGVF